MSALRAGTGPASSIYHKVHLRTLQRDIALLKQQGLVRVDNDAIVANLEIFAQGRIGDFTDRQTN